MSIDSIHKALDTKLKTLSGGSIAAEDIITENFVYDPTKGTAFLKSHLLPSQPVQATMGTTGQNIVIGIYWVNLFFPVDAGHSLSSVEADLVIALLKRGTNLTVSGVTVTIVSAGKQKSVEDADWYMTPVQINWRSFLAN